MDSDKVKQQLDAAKAESKRLEELYNSLVEDEKRQTDVQQLAILLHDCCCKHNHTDGCGWLYEITSDGHNWGLADHQAWLIIAGRTKQALTSKSLETSIALTVFECVKQGLGQK